VEGLDISLVHVRDLALSDRGQDLVFDHRPVVDLRAVGLFRQVLLFIPMREIPDRRRLPLCLTIEGRVFAAIDSAPQFLGLSACRFRAPVGIGPDREALFAAADTIIDKERSRARRMPSCRSEKAHAEPGDVRIPRCRGADGRCRLLLQLCVGYFKRHDVKSFDPQSAASFAFRQCRGAPFYGHGMPQVSF
jgi:hypothetical protein